MEKDKTVLFADGSKIDFAKIECLRAGTASALYSICTEGAAAAVCTDCRAPFLLLQHFTCICFKYVPGPTNKSKRLSQLAGFEPTRAEPIGFQVQRLNHSATTARYLPPTCSYGCNSSDHCVLTFSSFNWHLLWWAKKSQRLLHWLNVWGGVKRWDRPWQDSNLQSPDPKSGALSIRPQGLTVVSLGKLEPVSSRCCNAVGKLHIRLSSPIRYYQMTLIEYII